LGGPGILKTSQRFEIKRLADYIESRRTMIGWDEEEELVLLLDTVDSLGAGDVVIMDR
jgi:hypothetical protein